MPYALDLDGVIWLADDPIAGAAGAVARLQGTGEAVVFVTNNSNRPVAAVEAKLARHGVAAEGAVITSAMAAGRLLQPGERVLVCGGPGVVEAVEASGAVPLPNADAGVDADAVLVGFHREFDYERMLVAATAVRRGARLLATNDDATYPTPDGPIPGGGAILASIVTATGVAPVIAGKPHEAMAALVRERLGPVGVMVGDRPDTDGRFARVLGFDFALVHTGITTGTEVVEPPPDLIAADLSALVDHLLGGG